MKTSLNLLTCFLYLIIISEKVKSIEIQKIKESELDESQQSLLNYLRKEKKLGKKSQYLIKYLKEDIGVFYHNNSSDMLVLYLTNFKSIKQLPQLEAWIKVLKIPTDKQFVSEIEKIFKIEKELVVIFEAPPPNLGRGIREDIHLQNYLSDPVMKLSMYHSVFKSYSMINKVGYQDCKLDLDSFGYVMINGGLNPDGFYSVFNEEKPEYIFYFSRFGDLKPLSKHCGFTKKIEKFEKIRRVMDPRRVTGTAANIKDQSKVELYSLAFSILKAEADYFSKKFEIEGDGRKEVKVFWRSLNKNSNALREEEKYQKLYEKKYIRPFRPEPVEKLEEKINFQDGKLSLAVGISHPIKFVSLSFLMENLKEMILEYTKNIAAGQENESNFSFETIHQDVEYIIQCLVYFFEFENKNYSGKIATISEEEEEEENLNVLLTLVQTYSTILGFVSQMMIENYSLRPNSKEMESLLETETDRIKKIILDVMFPDVYRVRLI